MGHPVEPEVIANAVFRIARGRWREYWIGMPTLLTILGNTILPGFLDRYLARTAFGGQQTDLPIRAGRRDNLETPVTELHRTRGSFDGESGTHAVLVPGEVVRVGVAAFAALALLGLGVGVGRWTRGR
jgi:hypothetical protein